MYPYRAAAAGIRVAAWCGPWVGTPPFWRQAFRSGGNLRGAGGALASVARHSASFSAPPLSCLCRATSIGTGLHQRISDPLAHRTINS